MANRCLPVFEGVNWSTPQVWKQTLARLEKQNVAWERLPEMNDVDELEDLEKLTTFLESNPSEPNMQLLEAINVIYHRAEINE